MIVSAELVPRKDGQGRDVVLLARLPVGELLEPKEGVIVIPFSPRKMMEGLADSLPAVSNDPLACKEVLDQYARLWLLNALGLTQYPLELMADGTIAGLPKGVKVELAEAPTC